MAIPISDPRYPALLREIFDPPIVLFARGRVELLNATSVRGGGDAPADAVRNGGGGAAVGRSGARRAGDRQRNGAGNRYGGAQERRWRRRARRSRCLGCGVDIVYPSENRKLAAEIAAKGLLLSEFPMGSTAFPQNFPIRNRIISGMSVGILVVEGAQYSGSAITAKLALDQGREVFAVPGNITSKTSWGPNLLIKQGAKLVQEWNDVVAELPPEARRRLIERGATGFWPSSRRLPESEADRSCRPGRRPELGRWVLAQAESGLGYPHRRSIGYSGEMLSLRADCRTVRVGDVGPGKTTARQELC